MTQGNWSMIERPPLDDGVAVDARCEICWENGGGSMLECAGCKLHVHGACYGSASSTTSQGPELQRAVAVESGLGNFTCCVCAYWNQLGVRVSLNSLVCSLCNRSGGPMKCGVEGLWVHVACVLYSNDGPIFRNYTARACPMNLQKCLRQRHQCHLCLSCNGFSTKCSFPGCNKRMHITCAFQHQLKPKVVLISAKVPLSMYPDGQVDNGESKTVEKIIKIVTCQQHSSQNAQNAIENYEISQLQKTDITRLCQPRTNAPPDHPPPQIHQPPPPPAMDPATAFGPYGIAAPPAAATAGPNVAGQQQWAYPPQYYYYNQPPMGYYNTWSPHQYGYAQHILQRTAPYPNWGNAQYPMQPRVPQQATSAITPTPSLTRVRTTQTNPPPAPPPPKAEPKKKAKPKNQVNGAITVKAETSTTSPADLKKKRASTSKAGSNSGGRQKTGDVSSKARDKGKIGSGRASRLKSSEDYTACPTSLRGSRVNWSKLEPFMVPLQAGGAAADTTARLIALLDAFQTGAEATVKQAVRWSWVRDSACPPQVNTTSTSMKTSLNPPPLPGSLTPNYGGNVRGHPNSYNTSVYQQHPYLMNAHYAAKPELKVDTGETANATDEELTEEEIIEVLKNIWHARRPPNQGTAAYSVLLSTELGDKIRQHVWSFWTADEILDFTPLTKKFAELLATRPSVSPRDLAALEQESQRKEREESPEQSVSGDNASAHDNGGASGFVDDPMTGLAEPPTHELAGAYKFDAKYCGYRLETLQRQDSGELPVMKRQTSKPAAVLGSRAPNAGTKEPWCCASSELLFGFNIEPHAGENGSSFNRILLQKPSRRAAAEAYGDLISHAILGDTAHEKKNLSLDVCSWNEISRLESLFSKATQSAVFVLLRKVPPELFSSAKHVPSAALKYLQERENATFTLDAGLLKKTASTTKKVYLHSRFWDLNPPIPISDTRVLLPKNSYSVTANTGFMDSPADHIPISDETTREWLTAAQRVRQLRSQQQALGNNVSGHQSMDLSAPDFQKAVRGEEFVKLLSTEQYWHALLFKDDFVKRQMVSILSVWSKRRSRIMGGLSRIRNFVDNERQKKLWVSEDPGTGNLVIQNALAANRWSALRWWFQQGHQDPGQALVDRVKMEHEHRHSIQDGVPPATGDPNAPGATSSKMYFCMACFAADTDSLNPLTTCIRCGCLAHNSCYAVGAPGQLELESHPWLCDRCVSDKAAHDTSSGGSKAAKQLAPPPPASCCVCLKFGGCLKALSPLAFVHVTCAIWLFPVINCGDWGGLTDWHITLPMKTEVSGGTLFGDDAFLRSRLPDDQLLTANQIVEMNGDAICSICRAEGMEDISREKPFGSRGLVVKCVEENCQTYFHPICAWLEGYRVHATPNPYKPLTSHNTQLYLTALDIIPFCGDHSNYEGRLSLQGLSEHRKRAYCTKTGRFAGSLTNTGKETGAPPTSTSAKRAGTTRSETRRPSVTEKTDIMAVTWSVACTIRLTETDVYLDNVCQACLSTHDTEALVVCEGCERVRVHPDCDVGVLDDQRLCVSCSHDATDDLPSCFLCPRLGGAFVAAPDGSYVHRYCMSAATGKADGDMAEAWSSIHQLQTESGDCGVCGVSSGYLVRCEEESCSVCLHPLCAALIRNSDESLSTPESDDLDYGWPRLCAQHTDGTGELWGRLQRRKDAQYNGSEEMESLVSSNQAAGLDDSPDRPRNKRKRITLFGESSEDDR